jgi:hypothetical protein
MQSLLFTVGLSTELARLLHHLPTANSGTELSIQFSVGTSNCLVAVSSHLSSPHLSANCSFGTQLTLLSLSLSLMLRPTVSRPVCLGIKHPFGAYDQIFITCGAPSLTRGRVCLLYVLLALASAVFLGSESLGT